MADTAAGLLMATDVLGLSGLEFMRAVAVAQLLEVWRSWVQIPPDAGLFFFFPF